MFWKMRVYQGKTFGSASLPPLISSWDESGMLKQVNANSYPDFSKHYGHSWYSWNTLLSFGASSVVKAQMLTILCFVPVDTLFCISFNAIIIIIMLPHV